MKHIAKATFWVVIIVACFSCKKTVEFKQTQTTLSDFSFPYKSYGDADFEITPPTSNSPETFTYTSSNTNVAVVNGSTISIKNAGTTTIFATQKASDKYTQLTISADLTISTPRPTTSNFPAVFKFSNDAPFTLTAPTSNSTGAFTYEIGDPTIATVTGNKVTIKKAGKTYIKATQAAKGNYGIGVTMNDLTVTQAPIIGSVTDIDGNVYKTVKIGNQTWMMENLKVTRYQDGTKIPNVPTESAWRAINGTAAYCSYNNSAANTKTYGLLYNWYAVNDAHKLAPKGWHVPTDAEWQQLYSYIGGARDAGTKLREPGTTHWSADIGHNETGFTALGGGGRVFQTQGDFYFIGDYAYWWSATSKDATTAGDIDFYVKGYFDFGSKPKILGLSVRCVKD